MESRAGTLKEIVVATKNKGKITEFQAALSSLGITVRSLAEFGSIVEPIETGKTFRENAELKARYYAGITKMPCLADDSGLEVIALQGAPGVYSARYAGDSADDGKNNSKLLAELDKLGTVDRQARFVCVLALAATDGQILFSEGECQGEILSAPQGSGGFGYDPLFFVPALQKTMAELSAEEKNKISHRGMAVRLMAEQLAGSVL